MKRAARPPAHACFQAGTAVPAKPWRARDAGLRLFINNPDRRHIMKWETPCAKDMRFGFEITMYVANR